jgi:uncharacterized membrane protein
MDIFKGEKPLRDENNLIIVDKGKTVIHLRYPYFKQGMLLSCAGIGGIILYLSILRKKQLLWKK